MRICSNIAFEDETVALDGVHFKDCTFKGCELLYDGGVVILERTRFIECDYAFAGHARRTVDLLRVVGLLTTTSPFEAGCLEPVN